MDSYGISRWWVMPRSGMRHVPLLRFETYPASSNPDPSTKVTLLSSVENSSSV